MAAAACLWGRILGHLGVGVGGVEAQGTELNMDEAGSSVACISAVQVTQKHVQMMSYEKRAALGCLEHRTTQDRCCMLRSALG